jgi:hypothetical protein
MQFRLLYVVAGDKVKGLTPRRMAKMAFFLAVSRRDIVGTAWLDA